MSSAKTVPCLILAGGQSRRMGGGTKFLEKIGNKTLLEHIIHRVEPQVSSILLNSNIALEQEDFTVRSDVVTGHLGPLAGILTGLEYYQEEGSSASHMLSLPSDAPFIPYNLVEKLQSALTNKPNSIVMAHSKDRVHPVVALWPLSLAHALREALVVEDLRKILVFAERYNLEKVYWTDEKEDPFYNVNRPEDLEHARALAEKESL